MSIKNLFDQVIEVLNLFKPQILITMILGAFMLMVRFIKKMDAHMENRRLKELRAQYPEQLAPDREPAQSACPYCSQKYESETHYCSNCQTPF